jgi:hypothetical protein
MSPSVNTILGTSSITSADDALASAQQDQLATLQGLDKFIQARSKLLQDNMNRLPILQSLKPELDNLAKGLTPDGSTRLTTTDNGATVVLPTDVNASLQTQLEAAGLSLATEQRYVVFTETVDTNGNTSFGPAHLATSGDMTGIDSGTKGTTPGPFGGTFTTSTVTGTNGSQTVYIYNASSTETTASLSELKSLDTAVASAETTVGGDIKSETQDLQQASARLAQLARLGDAQYTALYAQHSKAQGEQRDQKREGAFDEVRLRNEDIARFQQDTSRNTGG